MHLAFIFALLAACTIISASPTIYFIRHGEKPSDGGTGLSPQGEERADCLREVFGASSGYNIGYIMAQKPKKNGKRIRPYLTVLPVAKDLGLEVDISCDRNDTDCVKDAIGAYQGNGNILICWQHGALTDIIEALGAEAAPEYPDDRYDLIWTDPYPYAGVTSEMSEMCPGLDT
ncbi:hypothetical protein BJX61DRAFT_545589 [Aspergillus egyptiacus]|nr:hypothetical protein BJX61DRAFT_545589 [Aspergillus egyptiacus]